ncbi:tetratricopeptide repeat protein [Paracraurococcus ruber]|uniref:Tetratricopeptide repeat protein n=1 Tax=Paracraurococcus ruber TaxID=77675 RepID=A0ABS1CWG0_9PROT|nr:tetratricopeptide repeat protein [Paracraurococcus ruber]MBK1658372.1 hypothetical protein [Paracraurococcus ruber]TDG30576.1 tetratricopeptide repeat protein [Paracraurococcus ruber]
MSLDSRLRLAESLGPNSPDALPLLRRAAAERPGDVPLRERLAATAEAAGRNAEAAEALRQANALQGPTQQRLTWLGRLELRAGNLPAAIEAHEQAVVLWPQSASAHAGLGLARDLAGDAAGAQEAYRRAIALAPQDWGPRANLGLSLVLSRQAPEAVQALAEAEYAPGAPRRARHNLALALVAAGRPDRATRLLRQDMGPSEAEVMAQQFAAMARQIDPASASADAGPMPAKLGRDARIARQAAQQSGAAPGRPRG